jgi:ABC-2 type transport system permease protein
MKQLLKEIAKHLRLYGALVRMNVMSQLEYRVNFVTGAMMEAGYLIVKLMYVLVVYRSGREIAGFSPDEILVFVGTFVLVTGFYAGLFMMNLFQLSTLVKDGSFDMLLTKPVSTQFLATFRRSDFALFLLDAGAGLIITAIGIARLGLDFSLFRVLGYAFFVASGSAVGYAIYLLPMTIVFRVVNAQAIAGLSDSFWDFNNVPMVVYNRAGQAFGIFVLPMFVITNFPALFALGRMSPLYAVWGAAAPVLFTTLTSLAWRAGVRGYSSASG